MAYLRCKYQALFEQLKEYAMKSMTVLAAAAAATLLSACVVAEHPGNGPRRVDVNYYDNDRHGYRYEGRNDRNNGWRPRPDHCPPGHYKKNWC